MFEYSFGPKDFICIQEQKLGSLQGKEAVFLCRFAHMIIFPNQMYN